MFLFGVSPRIALQEETNRMSANALAIVFAPCILRCHDTIDPLLSVQDIGKTTAYVLLCALQSHIQANKDDFLIETLYNNLFFLLAVFCFFLC